MCCKYTKVVCSALINNKINRKKVDVGPLLILFSHLLVSTEETTGTRSDITSYNPSSNYIKKKTLSKYSK